MMGEQNPGIIKKYSKRRIMIVGGTTQIKGHDGLFAKKILAT
jgi:hypothetical protein